LIFYTVFLKVHVYLEHADMFSRTK